MLLLCWLEWFHNISSDYSRQRNLVVFLFLQKIFLMIVVQVVRVKFFISFVFIVNLTTIHYTGLSQYLFTIYDLYFLSHQFSLMIDPKVRLLRKILVIFLINEIHRTDIIGILILLVNSVLYYGPRIIVRIIFRLHIDSTSIIIVSSKV